MNIVARPIDTQGHLWTVAPFDGAARPVGARESYQLHASRPDDVERTGAMALRAGLVVWTYEDEPGPAPWSFPRRIASIVASLRRLGELAARYERPAAAGVVSSVDGERGAIAWFLESRADLLLLGPVAFEKRRRGSISPIRLRRRESTRLH